MSVEVIPLGGGQDVGRSCILVRFITRSINSSSSSDIDCHDDAADEFFTVMFDCGVHMGTSDDERRRFFSIVRSEI